jgi:hypothetical protein
LSIYFHLPGDAVPGVGVLAARDEEAVAPLVFLFGAPGLTELLAADAAAAAPLGLGAIADKGGGGIGGGAPGIRPG